MLLPPRYQNPTKLPVNSMNPIYKAFDIETKQYVAIKVMKGDPYNPVNDAYLRKLFQHEIDVAHSLHHPHILEAIDSGEARFPYRTVPFITTSFMDEGSLKDFVDNLPSWRDWKLPQILDVIEQAANALEYIHQRDKKRPLVHRDVKLENFFVRRVNKPERIVHIYLSDFGISRTQQINITNHILGTVTYMPPEQFEGQLLPQTDQYSLAMMACFLLTGGYPLTIASSNAMDWYNLHRTGTRRWPTELNPRLLPFKAVDDVILKALSVNPEGRYPSIWQFAEALRNAFQSPIIDTPTVYPLPAPQLPTLAVKPATPLALPPAYAHHDDVTEMTDLAHRQRIADISTQPMPVKEKSAPAIVDWQALPPITVELPIKTQLPASPQALCWSYNGDYLACFFSDHAPALLDRHGRQIKELLVEAGHVACWSPAEDRLAMSVLYHERNTDYSKIVLLDAALEKSISKPFTLATFPKLNIDALDWSRRGQLAVWISEQNSILLYAIPPSLTRPISIHHRLNMARLKCNRAGTLHWSPDGTLLAAGTRDGALYCWRADTYQLVWQKPATQEEIYCLAWSPDSATLVVSAGDRQVTLWNVRNDHMADQWKNSPLDPRMLSISQQGLLLAASREPYLYFRTISAKDTAYIGKHPGRWLAVWSPTRTEFVTLLLEDDTVLVLWRMEPSG